MPEFKQVYDLYAPQGVVFVMLVGQTSPGTPASPQDAAAYKAQYGYQDGWIVVSDPNWAKTDAIINDPAPGIPSISILDQDLALRYVTTSTIDGGYQSKLIQILNQASP